jgi:WD40 repeat protein
LLLLALLCVALPFLCAARQRRTLQTVGHTGWVVTVAFAPDGKTIASGSHDETLKLWDARTGKLLRTINVYPNRKPTGSIMGAVVFAPDSRTVAVGSRYAPIQQWDVATGAWRRLFHGYVCGFRCSAVVFAPDGKTIAGGDGDAGTVKIWEVASGRVVRTFEKPRDEKNPRFPHNAEHILFSPDGSRLLADSGPGGLIQVWEVATNRELLRIETKADISSMALSPDGRLLLIGGLTNDAPRNARGLIALFDAETGREVRRFPGQWSKVNGVAFAPDGKLIASAGYALSDGDGFNVIKLWDAETGREVRELVGHTQAIHAIDFAPDGRTLVSGSQDGSLKLWDVATGATLRSFPVMARKAATPPPARSPQQQRRRAIASARAGHNTAHGGGTAAREKVTAI